MTFEPLMTLYLTDRTTPDEIVRAKASGIVHGVKLYRWAPPPIPIRASARWNTACRCWKNGRSRPAALLHGEVTDPDIDIFDREAVFIERTLAPLIARLPELRVVLEHITTAQAAEFVAGASANVAATLTAHHLLMNRNAMLVAASARTTTACRCSSAKPIARRCSGRHQRLGQVLPGHRQRPHAATPKRPPETAPACTPPTPRWSCTPKRLTRWVRWTN